MENIFSASLCQLRLISTATAKMYYLYTSPINKYSPQSIQTFEDDLLFVDSWFLLADSFHNKNFKTAREYDFYEDMCTISLSLWQKANRGGIREVSNLGAGEVSGSTEERERSCVALGVISVLYLVLEVTPLSIFTIGRVSNHFSLVTFIYLFKDIVGDPSIAFTHTHSRSNPQLL